MFSIVLPTTPTLTLIYMRVGLRGNTRENILWDLLESPINSMKTKNPVSFLFQKIEELRSLITVLNPLQWGTNPSPFGIILLLLHHHLNPGYILLEREVMHVFLQMNTHLH